MVNRIYFYFSEMLDYPKENLKNIVKESISIFNENASGIGADLQKAYEIIKKLPLPKLEEIYTATFDLQPFCFPYVSYQILGEGYDRSKIMVYLKELYEKYNFKENKELPDHIRIILKFLSMIDQKEIEQEIIEYLLVPSITKMVQSFENKENPYYYILNAIFKTLTFTATQGQKGGKND